MPHSELSLTKQELIRAHATLNKLTVYMERLHARYRKDFPGFARRLASVKVRGEKLQLQIESIGDALPRLGYLGNGNLLNSELHNPTDAAIS